MQRPDVLITNYALPIDMMLLADCERTKEYVQWVGANGLLMLPMRSRITSEILAEPTIAPQIPLRVVRQTYRGERGLSDIVGIVRSPTLRPIEKIKKVTIALKTMVEMKHKDESLAQVEKVVYGTDHRVDAMFEMTDAATTSARRMAGFDTARRQRRLVQLTAENVAALLGGGQPDSSEQIQNALKRNGLNAFSFHNLSSHQTISWFNHRDRRAMGVFAPSITQFEYTAHRGDLLHADKRLGDTRRLSQGFETQETLMIQELRVHGANIERIVYAVPGTAITDDSEKREIIGRLKEI